MIAEAERYIYLLPPVFEPFQNLRYSPTILEEEKSALVLQLLEIIEHQGSIIQQQAEQIQQLKDEIARLQPL